MPEESAVSAASEKWREAWRTSRVTPSPLAGRESKRALHDAGGQSNFDANARAARHVQKLQDALEVNDAED